MKCIKQSQESNPQLSAPRASSVKTSASSCWFVTSPCATWSKNTSADFFCPSSARNTLLIIGQQAIFCGLNRDKRFVSKHVLSGCVLNLSSVSLGDAETNKQQELLCHNPGSTVQKQTSCEQRAGNAERPFTSEIKLRFFTGVCCQSTTRKRK